MQTEFYEKVFQGLKDYIYKHCEYKAQVVKESPLSPQYPLIVFTEPRNVPINGIQTIYERKFSLGLRADIFAETKDGKEKTQIAREIAKCVENYLVFYEGLRCVSYNLNERMAVNGKICQIVIMFSTNILENKLMRY